MSMPEYTDELVHGLFMRHCQTLLFPPMMEKSCNLHQPLLYMQVEGTNPLIAGL